jgi:hypothetical protein
MQQQGTGIHASFMFTFKYSMNSLQQQQQQQQKNLRGFGPLANYADRQYNIIFQQDDRRFSNTSNITSFMLSFDSGHEQLHLQK